jgi:hypothetical protein
MVFSLNHSCTAQADKTLKNTSVSEAGEVEVIYFHFSRRCVTCKAVEEVSKQAVADLYGESVIFTGYNLEEQDGKEKGRDLGVSGQALLIVSGDTKINITNEGFRYARSNPEKLKQIISENITPLL